MAKLTDAIKEFIVIALACYDRPQQIANAVKEEFGVDIKRQQVEEYDPDKRCKTQKWVDLHATTRKKFLDDLTSEPAAQKSVRVRRLARMAERAESSRNILGAAQLYEQIAKEMGGLYTNRRELTGAEGKPLVPDRALEDLTEDELAALVAQLAKRADATGDDSGAAAGAPA